MGNELIHEELSEAIIGAAMKVLNTLKPGLDEKLYERALVIELRKRGYKVDQQRQFPVHYDGDHIGTLVPDLMPRDLTTFFTDNADKNEIQTVRRPHRLDVLRIYWCYPCYPWLVFTRSGSSTWPAAAQGRRGPPA